VNILAAIGLFLLLLLLFFASLSWITRHNKNIKVPGIVGQNIVAAKQMLESKGFDVEITDSVFIDTAARLSVIKQSPEADAEVKTGRTVYLTINRAVAPEVEMPSLIGFSFKSAQLLLQSIGLKMGDSSYRPDFARNSVLQQTFKGDDIKPGTKIPMGSTINVVLGSGLGSSDIDVPDVYGMTVQTARDYLASMSINVGSYVVQNGSVSDTLSAFVVDQNPKVFSEPAPGQKVHNKMRPGQLIDLYIGSTAPPPKVTDTTKTQP
jgi:beta-lactam-binding protein with PASTA domain